MGNAYLDSYGNAVKKTLNPFDTDWSSLLGAASQGSAIGGAAGSFAGPLGYGIGAGVGAIYGGVINQVGQKFWLPDATRSNPNDPKFGQKKPDTGISVPGYMKDPVRGNPNDPKSPGYVPPVVTPPPVIVPPTEYADYNKSNNLQTSLQNALRGQVPQNINFSSNLQQAK